MAPAQDYKRIFDGDRGPNTGGMGSYSPVPGIGPDEVAEIVRTVHQPVVDTLRGRGMPFHGVLYAGLMLTSAGPKVLEFNVRFGDPEAQVLLARLRSDLADVMVRTCDGRLAGTTLDWDPRAAVCVVLAAEGYPGTPVKGVPIDGLETLRDWRDGVVFHAGTTRADGRVVVDGGRVLGVTALGDTIRAAVDEAYRGVARIGWPGMQHRRDIGHRALTAGTRVA
jgi:phosphoribosylamine--glycine ligase